MVRKGIMKENRGTQELRVLERMLFLKRYIKESRRLRGLKKKKVKKDKVEEPIGPQSGWKKNRVAVLCDIIPNGTGMQGKKAEELQSRHSSRKKRALTQPSCQP